MSYAINDFENQVGAEFQGKNYEEFIVNHYKHQVSNILEKANHFQDRILSMDWINKNKFMTSMNNKNILFWKMNFSTNGKLHEITCEKTRLISPISGYTIKIIGSINQYIGISNCLKDLNVYFWDLNNKVKPTHIFRGQNKDLIKGISL
jgi:hypothetical protein